MQNKGWLALAAAVATGFAATAWAQGQNGVAPVPQNVVQLSASAVVQVPQDWLVMTLVATVEGRDAQATQAELQKALEAAVTRARAQVQGGQGDALQVRTGRMGIYPRHDSEGRPQGWRGEAELILQGRDFARVTQVASQIDTMVVRNVQMELSRQAAAKVQEDAQAQAIANFRQQAGMLTKQFGFSAYTLREVQVNTQHHGPHVPQMAMMARAGDAVAASAPMAVEAGLADVEVQVSGSIQMQ